MNIDFHYGVIYVVARVAGMNAHDAEIVAHACQYVDDATVTGRLEFDDGEVFDRFASAHVMYDYRNVVDEVDRAVWVPFHFLPGGRGASIEEKAVCVADSDVAREMVRSALSNDRRDNALHRLGVTLHTYVDTWAHQNFAGIISDVNAVRNLTSVDHDGSAVLTMLGRKFENMVHAIEGGAIDGFCRLGHGAALHFPDIPWAKWEYTDGSGRRIARDNLPDFIDAAGMACRVIRAFLKSSIDFEGEPGLPPPVADALRALLGEGRLDDESERLRQIAVAFGKGRIPGFAEALPTYVAKGPGSWKYEATGIAATDGDGGTKPRWRPDFEASNYRLVHDAIVEHRFDMTRTILPAHGIRLA